MAKKKDAKKSKQTSRADAVRAAVDQAFQATANATAGAGQLTRGRAAEIADELVGNITRMRDALEDVRPATPEDIKALRSEIATLAERVGRLETARAAEAITGTPAAAKPAATRAPSRRTAAKPAAAAKPKPAAPAKTGATGAARAKPAAASKPKPAAPAKTGAAARPRARPQ
jgi:polyhydroxyalkanoate synthesis regulator phasin